MNAIITEGTKLIQNIDIFLIFDQYHTLEDIIYSQIIEHCGSIRETKQHLIHNLDHTTHISVSYTHLDVYKRQAEYVAYSASLNCPSSRVRE